MNVLMNECHSFWILILHCNNSNVKLSLHLSNFEDGFKLLGTWPILPSIVQDTKTALMH